MLSVSDPLVILRLIECAVLIGFGRLMWLDSVASLYLDWPLITHYFLSAQAAKRIGPVFIQGLIVSLSISPPISGISRKVIEGIS